MDSRGGVKTTRDNRESDYCDRFEPQSQDQLTSGVELMQIQELVAGSSFTRR